MAAIHVHAAKGRADKVREVLLSTPLEADVVNAKDAFGNTPLMAAAYRGQDAVVELLVQHGADLNACDRNGRTALMWAAKEGRRRTVELLIHLGADVTLKEHALNADAEGMARGPHVREVLKRYRPEQVHVATKKGDYAAVQRLLQACPSHLECRDDWGNTPLMSASYRNEAPLVDLLLTMGADINARDREGRTALVWASWKGLEPVVLLLLHRGADVRVRSNTGMTALSSAARSGNMTLVRLLMTHGAEVNERDDDGRTALMAAAFAGDLGLMELLLSHGADLEMSDTHGMTALMFAAAGDHKDAVTLLASRGAAVDAQNNHGWTALLAAAKRDNRELVEALLSLGANLHIANDLQRDKAGNPTSRGNTTPLAMAARHGKLVMVRCLVGHGADLYQRDGHGLTAEEAARKDDIKTFLRRCRESDAKIYAAAERGLLDETRRLFLASPYHDRNNGETGWADRALFLAACWGDEFRIRLWLQHGASLSSRDRLGRSLLHVARTPDITRVLQEAGAVELPLLPPVLPPPPSERESAPPVPPCNDRLKPAVPRPRSPTIPDGPPLASLSLHAPPFFSPSDKAPSPPRPQHNGRYNGQQTTTQRSNPSPFFGLQDFGATGEGRGGGYERGFESKLPMWGGPASPAPLYLRPSHSHSKPNHQASNESRYPRPPPPTDLSPFLFPSSPAPFANGPFAGPDNGRSEYNGLLKSQGQGQATLSPTRPPFVPASYHTTRRRNEPRMPNGPRNGAPSDLDLGFVDSLGLQYSVQATEASGEVGGEGRGGRGEEGWAEMDRAFYCQLMRGLLPIEDVNT